MKMNKKITICLWAITLPFFGLAQSPSADKTLETKSLKIVWNGATKEKTLKEIVFKQKNKKLVLPVNTGNFSFIYSKDAPSKQAVPAYKSIFGKVFIDTIDRHAYNEFDRVLNEVSFNTAGTAAKVQSVSITIANDTATIIGEHPTATIISKWHIVDYLEGSDIQISTTLIAKQDGYYSMATPNLLVTKENEIAWATIPGYFQGSSINQDIVKAYGYGWGIPSKPVVFRDRNAATLTSILSRTDGITLAVTAHPGYGRDPWANNTNTHNTWRLGLAAMDRWNQLSPTLYYPVLGERGSLMKKNDRISFSFTITLAQTDWFTVLKHAINDIYQFNEGLALRSNQQSLINRIGKLKDYVSNDKTSLWRVEDFNGLKIGAQAYLGTVTGATRDAMKNSDYGAMWMMANIAQDSLLKKERLPYARNFKLEQQQASPGFFEGASIGQYYLSKSKRFTEEWGDYVEPIGLTYYTMLDLGNILLFNPADTVLRERLRLGADRLLQWQNADGNWEVAYRRSSEQPAFSDLKDFRPTFYGLIVGYRILKDNRYLQAAKKGADWYIKNAVEKGYFLGVCGDARYVPDFATIQSAQALLDLYEITGEEQYKDAAVKTAQMYVGSIYTYPIPSNQIRIVKGIEKPDWQIAQAGLGFEHGGNFGSATTEGPILLSGHAGLFVRMFGYTKDPVFLNMARAAAIGRDAFVNKTTNVASYYWTRMDNGAGPYPHHAWWQIGWIMDYLMAEVEVRSGKQISFPRGFVTPKVGPHQSYGFAPGKIYGQPASLAMYNGLVESDNPNVELITAVNDKTVYLLVVNDIGKKITANLKFDLNVIGLKGSKIYRLENQGKTKKREQGNNLALQIEGYGLQVYAIKK